MIFSINPMPGVDWGGLLDTTAMMKLAQGLRSPHTSPISLSTSGNVGFPAVAWGGANAGNFLVAWAAGNMGFRAIHGATMLTPKFNFTNSLIASMLPNSMHVLRTIRSCRK